MFSTSKFIITHKSPWYWFN